MIGEPAPQGSRGSGRGGPAATDRAQIDAAHNPELPRQRGRSAVHALAGELADHPGPNWFAAVMGTGILANAAALLPVESDALRDLALAAWILAAALLIVLVAATITHWLLHPERARRHHRDPRMAPFYGAPPMAMLTVGAGALLLGKDLIGLPAAVRVVRRARDRLVRRRDRHCPRAPQRRAPAATGHQPSQRVTGRAPGCKKRREHTGGRCLRRRRRRRLSGGEDVRKACRHDRARA